MKVLPLKVKAAVVFVLLATIPAVVTGALLSLVNADAVRTSERQLQTAVLAELSAYVDLQVAAAKDEARALADAIAAEASADSLPSLEGMRAVLKTTRHLAAAHLVIPGAKLDVPLLTASDGSVLEPKPARLEEISTAGAVKVFTEGGQVELAMRIAARGNDAPPAFVVARMSLEPIRERLKQAAIARLGGVRSAVLLVDEDKRTVAEHGVSSSGYDGAKLSAIWRLVPDKYQTGFAMVGTVDLGGESALAGVESLPVLGWQLAVWRPTSEAYASLGVMVQRAGLAAICATILALALGLIAAARLTKPILAMAAQAERIGRRAWSELRLLPKSGDELGQLASSIDDMAGALKSSEEQIAREVRLRTGLSRYMSEPLVEQIVRDQLPVTSGREQDDVTVLFGSVVSFTSLAEGAKAEQIVALLNELYALLAEIVFRNGGIVDKFFGDGVMAAWGTPKADPHHASNALEAAQDIQRFVDVASDDWERRFGFRVRMAIGLNSGECIAGNLGSDKRMEYTVIGDTVNVAARLEKEAAPGQILITEATKSAAADGFEYTFIGEHRLSGRRGLSRVYALELD